jgi:hypothetical protein
MPSVIEPDRVLGGESPARTGERSFGSARPRRGQGTPSGLQDREITSDVHFSVCIHPGSRAARAAPITPAAAFVRWGGRPRAASVVQGLGCRDASRRGPSVIGLTRMAVDTAQDTEVAGPPAHAGRTPTPAAIPCARARQSVADAHPAAAARYRPCRLGCAGLRHHAAAGDALPRQPTGRNCRSGRCCGCAARAARRHPAVPSRFSRSVRPV